MRETKGLISAFRLDGKGGGAPLTWEQIRAHRPEEGPVWIQLNLAFDPSCLENMAAVRHHLPDFAVLDPKGRQDETGWDACAAGWFSPSWEIDDDSVYFRADARAE